MTSYNDLFVATVAFIGSACALGAGVGPWHQPYQLRSIAAIVDRYGMTVARSVWIGIALISLIAGAAIAGGLRPGYAQPEQGSVGAAR